MSDSKSLSPANQPTGSRKGIRWLPLAGGLVACSVLWQVISLVSGFPAFILPTPLQVAEKFLQALSDGVLLQNAIYTLTEVLAGMALGVGSAVKSRIFNQQIFTAR